MQTIINEIDSLIDSLSSGDITQQVVQTKTEELCKAQV